jgi:L-cysteine:1D-myo-inositol 2-amino-2-deoxy-alpha-D-glucopyranoside ligase
MTGVRLFDTASRKLEEVSNSGNLGVYVCGITPYAAAHIGHAMVYLTYDLLIRRLRDRGHEVAYVRNITDVDDSILEYARAHKVNYLALGESEEARFGSEMSQLNLLPPDQEPRATHSIQSTVELIRELTAGGFTYVLDGDTYFNTAAFEGFGNLSKYPDTLRLAHGPAWVACGVRGHVPECSRINR